MKFSKCNKQDKELPEEENNKKYQTREQQLKQGRDILKKDKNFFWFLLSLINLGTQV